MRLDNCMINYSFPWLVDSQSHGTHCAVVWRTFFCLSIDKKNFWQLNQQAKSSFGGNTFSYKVARSFAKFVTKQKHLFRFYENIFFWQFHEIGFLKNLSPADSYAVFTCYAVASTSHLVIQSWKKWKKIWELNDYLEVAQANKQAVEVLTMNAARAWVSKS